MSTFQNSAPKYSWRERQAQKAEEAQRKIYSKTETNFPTLVTTAHRIQPAAPQGYAKHANDWREQKELAKQMEAYRKARTARDRREILNTVFILRRRLADDDYVVEDDDDVATIVTDEAALNEAFPPHGRRGTYSEVFSDPVDGEGWRLVMKRQRKPKRELTEAELAQKYREEFFERNEDGYEDDVNGDLMDRNQRREFY